MLFLNQTFQQQGFLLGELVYADQSVIDVDSDLVERVRPEITPTDQGMWQLNGKAHWKDDGRLAVSSNAQNSAGWAFTTNSYPVTGSWSADFDFELGLTSATPADYITFTIQNSSPSTSSATPKPGFAIMWRLLPPPLYGCTPMESGPWLQQISHRLAFAMAVPPI